MDRSCQPATKQRFVSTWPQIWSKSVEISFQNACARSRTSPSRPHQTTFILIITASILAIASRFDAVLGIGSREFGDLKHCFHVLNNDFKLKLECDFDCDVSSSHARDTPDTIGVTHSPLYNFDSTGVLLAEVKNLKYDSSAVSTATTITTKITNENKNKMKYECDSNGPHTSARAQAKTQHSTASVTERQ